MTNPKSWWCDSTITKFLGCLGCDLFPSPHEVTRRISAAVASTGVKINSRALLKEMIHEHHAKLKNPDPDHRDAVTTTNIWHFQYLLRDTIARKHGSEAGNAALTTIRRSIKCRAARYHLDDSRTILDPERTVYRQYLFEELKPFEGRMAKAAGFNDLLGRKKPGAPWKDGLPRMIFVSDVGDTFNTKALLQFLKRDSIPAITSEKGRRHLWLWLTKQPKLMARFARRFGGLPANVCAMTTLTGPDELHRVDELRSVDAACRGLLIEPLCERIPIGDLDLAGIDWVVVGGESGSGILTRSFDVAWAEELQEHCRERGVAFFLNQLGRKPIIVGNEVRLVDPHGGDWNEWPRSLRIREFPAYFHHYRADEKAVGVLTRP